MTLRNRENYNAWMRRYYRSHLEKMREKARNRYQRNRTKILQYTKRYSETHKEQRKMIHKAWRLKNPTWMRDRLRKIRTEVLIHYGGNPPKCKCCEENTKEFLSIDHINNDGKEHRKTVKASYLAPWIKKNNFPSGFQVLCYNCNLAKGFLGYCPHQNNL